MKSAEGLGLAAAFGGRLVARPRSLAPRMRPSSALSQPFILFM